MLGFLVFLPEKGKKERVKERGEEEEGKKNKTFNHQFLAMGISSTQETLKTAGGCVCVFPVMSFCVSTHVLLSLKEKEVDALGPSGVPSYIDELEMFASHLDSCELVLSFYSCETVPNQRQFYLRLCE